MTTTPILPNGNAAERPARNVLIRGFNAKVHRITKRQLNRAANALADLIASVA